MFAWTRMPLMTGPRRWRRKRAVLTDDPRAMIPFIGHSFLNVLKMQAAPVLPHFERYARRVLVQRGAGAAHFLSSMGYESTHWVMAWFLGHWHGEDNFEILAGIVDAQAAFADVRGIEAILADVVRDPRLTTRWWTSVLSPDKSGFLTGARMRGGQAPVHVEPVLQCIRNSKGECWAGHTPG